MILSPTEYLTGVRAEIHGHLVEELIPFWLERSIDPAYGGYLTAFDGAGQSVDSQTDKFVVMQTRMVWSFARFSRFLAQDHRATADLKAAAHQGVDFLLRHMWDAESGGWFWQCARNGQVIQADKVVYGQSFAIYALAEYTLATGDPRGLEYADRTFDLLQRYSADVAHGGYYEGFTRDWALSAGEYFGGDRKSLNTHMHLMEAFTTLAQASGRAVHARRLQELVDLISKHMVDNESGAGHDWFDLEFHPLPSGEVRTLYRCDDGQLQSQTQPLAPPVFLNSYGHDVELAWLLTEAAEVLGQPRDIYLDVARGLVAHALAHGLDRTYGGFYDEGRHNGPALSRCKGWWQQAEALVGLLDLYEITRQSDYLEAFRLAWDFVNRHMINHAVGEWRALLTEDGQPIQDDLGHPWKCAYHTGRAMVEMLLRLDRLLNPPA
jgi:mannose/cellobiose epimerase-like protein (N-acyl-D-glucosamine 2-epimerase family)